MNDDDLDQRIRNVVRSAVAAPPPPPPLRATTRLSRSRVVLTALLATVLVVAVGVGGIALRRDDPGSRLETAAAPDRCRHREPPTVLEGRDASGRAAFESLPPGPLDGRNPAGAVWTGDEVIAWGTRSDAPSPQESVAAAAYDPVRRAWRDLPNVPAIFRSDNAGGTTVTVWTGREMVIWGEPPPPGTATVNAVAYNPRRDRWRLLPPAPVDAAGGLVATWTGKEMLVWGGTANAGAAYNPCKNRWRGVSPSPIETRFQATAVWTGQDVIVFGGNESNNAPLRDGAAYDPRSDTWRTISRAAVFGYYAHSAVWSGREMVVWGWSNLARDRAAENQTAVYDPQDDQWRVLQPAPLVPYPPNQQGEGTGGSVAVWAGDRMLAWSGTLDAEGPLVLEYRPRSDTWTRLSRAPDGSRAYFPTVVWTGSSFIVLGAGPEGQALELTTRASNR